MGLAEAERAGSFSEERANTRTLTTSKSSKLVMFMRQTALEKSFICWKVVELKLFCCSRVTRSRGGLLKETFYDFFQQRMQRYVTWPTAKSCQPRSSKFSWPPHCKQGKQAKLEICLFATHGKKEGQTTKLGELALRFAWCSSFINIKTDINTRHVWMQMQTAWGWRSKYSQSQLSFFLFFLSLPFFHFLECNFLGKLKAIIWATEGTRQETLYYDRF